MEPHKQVQKIRLDSTACYRYSAMGCIFLPYYSGIGKDLFSFLSGMNLYFIFILEYILCKNA